MLKYEIRDVPPEIWKPFRERAEQEGWHLRALLLQLMTDYSQGAIDPTIAPTPRPYRGIMNVRCPNCDNASTINLRKADVALVLKTGVVPCPYCGHPIVLAHQDLADLSAWARTANPVGERAE
jgi:ribosomal protein S27E